MIFITFLATKLVQEPGEGPPPGGGIEGPPVVPEIINPALSGKIRWMTGTQFFNALLPNLIGTFIIVGVIISFLAIIFGGIKWITASGNQERLGRAKQAIVNALIGLVIVLGTFAILRLVGAFLGINLIKFDIGSLFLK